MATERRPPLERVTRWTRQRPWVGDVTLALVLAGALLPSSIYLIRIGDPGQRWSVVLPSLLVLMHAAIAWRRASPVGVFLGLALALLVLAVAPYLHNPDPAGSSSPAILLPSALTYLVAAYTVGAHSRHPWPVLSLVVGVSGAVLVVARMTLTNPAGAEQDNNVWELFFLAGALLAAVTASWAMGRFRRLGIERVAALIERADRAEADRETRMRRAAAEERSRIARELHDVIAHSVTVMVRQAEGGRYVASTDPEAASKTLTTIAETGREALTDIRALLGVLASGPRESTPDPQPTLDDLPELVSRIQAAGHPVKVRVVGEPRGLDRAASLAAFRLVQEALTNVVKHAGPGTMAEVQLAWTSDWLRLCVTDHGAPPPATAGGPADGRGLIGMRERLHLVGGRLTVGPGEPRGFEVVGEIPTSRHRQGAC